MNELIKHIKNELRKRIARFPAQCTHTIAYEHYVVEASEFCEGEWYVEIMDKHDLSMPIACRQVVLN